MKLYPAKNGGIVVWRNNAYVLTHVEYELLVALEATDVPITGEQLGKKVFPLSAPHLHSRMISVYVEKIRRKVDRNIIQSRKRVGYWFGKETLQLQTG